MSDIIGDAEKISPETEYDQGFRVLTRIEREEPCVDEHEWQHVSDTQIYADRRLITEICLFCDTPQTRWETTEVFSRALMDAKASEALGPRFKRDTRNTDG